MFEASTKLQTVSSEVAAEKGLPDWIEFQTAADEVSTNLIYRFKDPSFQFCTLCVTLGFYSSVN
jgi:hypothetical protein